MKHSQTSHLYKPLKYSVKGWKYVLKHFMGASLSGSLIQATIGTQWLSALYTVYLMTLYCISYDIQILVPIIIPYKTLKKIPLHLN